MSEPGRVRAFLAVPPDPDWSQSARALVSRLGKEFPPASWTRPESWHLTLRFLGEVPQDSLDEFATAIGAAAAGRRALELSPGGSIVFPARGAAWVLGVGFAEDSGAAALLELAREAERCARAIRLEPERRPFHPHVTLARLRRPWPASSVALFRGRADGWAFPVWSVRSCVLFTSRLAPEGAVHTPVSQWVLAPEEVTA